MDISSLAHFLGMRKKLIGSLYSVTRIMVPLQTPEKHMKFCGFGNKQENFDLSLFFNFNNKIR
ncbi:MAG: hypothetical protein A7316_05190 [Candidatus Altiarchaeales archaeon WOR_SM1_86-2]|nr:MAG: hypothetical protein A7316_05190 [Candidatus Altiarchaeales archaeon WOR_SM1_86-2]